MRSTDGPEGLPYVLPAAAARDEDGTAILLTEWFGAPGDQLPVLSRSGDLRSWTVGLEPIFTDLGLGLADPGPLPQSLVRLDDGTWLLFGWGSTPQQPSSLFTWIATAPEPRGPWTVAVPRALEAGPIGSWDSQTAAVSSVLADESGFRLWYEGEGPGSTARGDIGLATSTDGASWQKWDDPATTDPALAASDPVLARGICGPGTAAELVQAQVERAGEGYVAVFGGRGGPQAPMNIYAATSSDGIAWTCSSTDPIFESAGIPASQGIHTIQSLPLEDGSIALVLESLGDGASDLWLATVEVAP